MLTDDILEASKLFISLFWVRNCPHFPLLEANVFTLLLLFLFVGTRLTDMRHGQPNKEIKANKSIQGMLLTFLGESQWCLWHQAAGIVIGM